MDWPQLNVTVTGGAGFLGRAVCEKLAARGCQKIAIPRRADYDLTVEADVARMYDDHQPHIVIHLAAEVGGIGANRDHPGRFFYANAAMGLHLIEHARRRNINKFIQAGTVCAYPKHTPTPFREENLWDGYPEETNAPYGVAKKALLCMLDAYKRQYNLASAVVVPVNLYGPADNFHPHTSHVIPALIRKCCQAVDRGDPSITCWGTGAASREFLYVGDAADAILTAAERIDDPVPINLGTGREITIRDLAELIAQLCGFTDEIQWDTTQPDGQPRRCLDIARAKDLLNWQAAVDLEEGLRRTIDWYRSQDEVREVVYE